MSVEKLLQNIESDMSTSSVYDAWLSDENVETLIKIIRVQQFILETYANQTDEMQALHTMKLSNVCRDALLECDKIAELE